MSMGITEKICLQDELNVLMTIMNLKTFAKGYHVYKETWIVKEGKQLEVFMDLGKLNKKIFWTFKEKCNETIYKIIFFSFCEGDPYSNPLCKSLKNSVLFEMFLVDWQNIWKFLKRN